MGSDRDIPQTLEDRIVEQEQKLTSLTAEIAKLRLKKADALPLGTVADHLLEVHLGLFEMDEEVQDFINKEILPEKRLWTPKPTNELSGKEIGERYRQMIQREDKLSRELKEEERLLHLVDSRDDRKAIKDDQRAIRKLQATAEVLGFGIIGPVAAADGAARLLGDDSRLVPWVTASAFFLGNTFAFRRRLKSSWNSAKEITKHAGKELRNSFAVFYIKESIREKLNASQKTRGLSSTRSPS